MTQFINESIIKKLPVDHFGITQEVINNLSSGQCGGIYGIPGYGMDFFAKHIALHMRERYPEIKIILLNLNLENKKTHVLEKELAHLLGVAKIDDVNLRQKLNTNRVLVILSEVYHPNYPKLFKMLKAICAINQKHFTVLVVASHTLLTQAKEYLTHDEGIFTPLKRIDPFDLEGVRRIIRINNEEYHWNIPLKHTKKIFFLSGGNPALVKYICMAIYEESELILNHLDKLSVFQPLNFRLSEIAQLTIKLSIEQQLQLGILNNNGTLFSGLLAEFLKDHELEGLDLMFPDLTKTDRRILTLFIQNPNRIIDKEQLSLVLEQSVDNYSEWAIYKAVARLRDKVRDKYTIRTLKGRGWRLETN